MRVLTTNFFKQTEAEEQQEDAWKHIFFSFLRNSILVFVFNLKHLLQYLYSSYAITKESHQMPFPDCFFYLKGCYSSLPVILLNYSYLKSNIRISVFGMLFGPIQIPITGFFDLSLSCGYWLLTGYICPFLPLDGRKMLHAEVSRRVSFTSSTTSAGPSTSPSAGPTSLVTSHPIAACGISLNLDFRTTTFHIFLSSSVLLLPLPTGSS